MTNLPVRNKNLSGKKHLSKGIVFQDNSFNHWSKFHTFHFNAYTFKTHPRVERDLLMLAASFSRSPSAPEDFCLLKSKAQFQMLVPIWYIHKKCNHDSAIQN